MDVSPRERGILVFGRFRLDPMRRSLWRDGREVALTARLFDTLLYLAQHPERLVTRDELASAVWGGRVVEDGNLQKAISALRKALQGDGLAESIIITVPGRGFQFVVPVTLEAEEVPGAVSASFGDAGVTGSQPVARPSRSRRMGAMLGVGALALVAGGGVAWHFALRPPAFAPPPHSVAVMPFSNLSGDPRQEYFSDGLSEELINALGRVDALHVAARLSSFSFKGKSATVGEIAHGLNVATVLEGSVRRDGTHVRVTVQLIDAVSGYQLWSRSYDRDAGDMFRLQGEIAEATAQALQVSLLGNVASRFTLGGTTNAAAFDAYVRGTNLIRNGVTTEDAVRQALAAFDEAAAQDPNFALAHMKRSTTLIALRGIAANKDAAAMKQLSDKALAEAELAVSLAPDLGAAHSTLSNQLLLRLDLPGAEAEIARAVDLAPGDATILNNYGASEVWLGHTERGVAAARRAIALNPLAPAAYGLFAWTLYFARHYDEALDALQHRQALGAPTTAFWSTLSGYIHFFKGDAEAARRTCEAAAMWQENECLALAYHALGRQADADAQLAKVRSLIGDTRPYEYVTIYAQWGETQNALHWLDIAYKAHDYGLYLLKSDPVIDPIRATDRYKEIERALNFPP
jgi:TolB-like protein/DNA-binding winged helix-turn-helix (wHTH) protein